MGDATALISIVTVTLNDAERLEKTISSLSPVYGDPYFEHLVIDGGSSDRTSDLVKAAGRFSNFVHIQKADQGIYDAMNRGVSVASGRFIWFLNCGDTLVADKKYIIQECRRYCDRSEVDIFCFPFLLEEISGAVKFRAVGNIGTNKLPTSHQGMFFSSKFLSQNKYNSQYRIAGDYDLYLRADRSKVLGLSDGRALVKIEKYGVASSNPLISYREYWRSAISRLTGIRRIKVCLYIAVKAPLVICYKKFVRKITGY